MTLSIIDLCVISSFIRHKGGGGCGAEHHSCLLSVLSVPVCRERQRATPVVRASARRATPSGARLLAIVSTYYHRSPCY